MSETVFISYNRVDSSMATALADGLRARGLDVWIDQRNIPVTVPWMDEIEVGLQGAAVMVVIDSPHWRKSENCQAEIRLAERWLVPIVTLNPEIHLTRAVDEVVRSLGARSLDDRVRTELFARAGQWSMNGRATRDLVGGRALARYDAHLNSLPAGTPVPTEVRAFVRISRTRQTRKRRLRSVGALVAATLVLIGIQAAGAFSKSKQEIDTAIQSFAAIDDYQRAFAAGPYQHLELLTQSDSDGESVRWELARAFSVPLPDQVVAVAESPLGGELRRRAGAHSAASTDKALTATLSADGRRVDVVGRDGGLVRTVPLSFSGRALGWSPDAAWLAVAADGEIQFLDIRQGGEPVVLRGASAPVDAVVVDAGGVTGLVGGDAVHWPTPFGTQIPVEKSPQWTAGAAIQGTDKALLLGRNGQLAVVDIAERRVVARADVTRSPAEVTGDVAVSPDGTTAVVSGVDTEKLTAMVHVVDVRDLSVRTFPSECVPRGVAMRTARQVYVACGQAGVGVFDTQTGSLQVKPIDQWATGIAVGDGAVYVGTNFGYIFEFDPDTLAVTGRGGNGCPADVAPIAALKSERIVFGGGAAAANFGCAARVTFGESTKADHLMFPWQSVNRAGTVSLGPNDKLLSYAFDDGTVRVFNAADFTAVAIRRPMPDPIRAAVFSQDGKTLMVAGRGGDIRLLDLSLDDGDNANQRRRAAAALVKAKELGLTH